MTMPHSPPSHPKNMRHIDETDSADAFSPPPSSGQRQSSTNSTYDESEEAVSSHVHRPWSDRALCRFLLAQHVRPATIHAQRGWSLATIYKIKRDRYVAKDNKRDDAQYIGTESHAILRKMQDQESAASKPARRGACAPGGRLRGRSLSPRAEDLDHSRHRDEQPGPHSRRSRAPSAGAIGGDSHAFLQKVLRSIGMYKWLVPLLDVGLTDDTLRAFTTHSMPKATFVDFLMEELPTMSSVDRYILQEAVWARLWAL
ncbi:hypothetical protein FB451DRAFT_1402667 [Mycena latifolia]|nr:hypothetical protein FB451DRAFT_1402667 [Mycena latifolia]